MEQGLRTYCVIGQPYQILFLETGTTSQVSPFGDYATPQVNEHLIIVSQFTTYNMEHGVFGSKSGSGGMCVIISDLSLPQVLDATGSSAIGIATLSRRLA